MPKNARYNASAMILDFAVTSARLQKPMKYVLKGYRTLGLTRGERRLTLKLLREVGRIDWKYKVLPLAGMNLVLCLPEKGPKVEEFHIEITNFPYYREKNEGN